jgi:Zn-dependent protease with chaperone function
MSTVTESARVQQVVDEMARTIGLQPPRVRVCDTKECASVGKNPRRELTLHADPKLSCAPLSVLRKMLAHELAHVWCRHPTSQRRTIGLIFAAAFGIWLAALIWGCPVDRLRHLVLDLSLIALGCCAIAVALLIRAARSRAYEREADRTAVDLFGIGVDDEVANWMQANGFCDDQTFVFLRTGSGEERNRN